MLVKQRDQESILQKSSWPSDPLPTKPTDRPLSAASERLYDKWGLDHDSTNEFYTSFRYREVTGIGREAGISRRDPTTVLKLGDTYYVWYTRRKTANDRDHNNRPSMRGEQTWDTPVFDWDLAEIWYATSANGFDWVEQGVAVTLGPRGAYDERSVFTPDVLMANGKFYLYYQAVDHPYVTRTRNTIGMSWADSPAGPWQRWESPVLSPGAPGEWLGDDDSRRVKRYGAWDSHKVHDPFILVREGKFWLYYKGQPMGWGTEYCRGIGWGVAIADRPEGPFVKHPLNPVTNSGHETCLFPYGEGLMAICGHDGPEKDMIQYASDGLNFEVMANVVLPPCAAGPFAPDSYNDTKDGQGITWGLAHIATEEMRSGNSYIVRFDCNLSKQVERTGFRSTNARFPESVYFSPDMRYNPDEAVWHVPDPQSEYPIKPDVARPSKPISAASQRIYDIYGPFKDQQSEFFSAFKYVPIAGVGKEAGVSRCDPSKVIKVGHLYYVWYTRRKSASSFVSIENAAETVPAHDSNLAEIWYATSTDGVHWQEQGVAVTRGPAGEFDARVVVTPDILIDDGRYCLYYQTMHATNRARYQIGMSWADSPDGPWYRWPELILTAGDAVLTSPYLLKRNGQIWLYHKGAGCKWGVAIADRPEGPFVHSPLNPITNSGHETFLYPFSAGVVAVTSLDGPEKNTIQYAPDGLNFEVMGKVSAPPIAAGPYVPDAFADNGDGQGVTWGLAHIVEESSENLGGQADFENSYLVRFECNLSREIAREGFYRPWNFRFPESAYFARGFRLSAEMKQEAIALMTRIDNETVGIDMMKDVREEVRE